ncbi:MAG TPA: winged helix-turn-helix domain-containing protein [Myxococcota bacterium]|nr:winged helix-turn-helix domain-containing protein [Myxococcota bacterium]
MNTALVPPRRQRYCFAGFTVSPGRRVLLRGGQEVPLIPRYLDLLILLLERRHEAVHRREIMDAVWSDVVVSDGALTQAIRTLRRALGDESREPTFIRTVSRHGYRFVHDGVDEEPDDAPLAAPSAAAPVEPSAPDPFEAPLAIVLDPRADPDERRAAAETLHTLGTAESLRRLDRHPGHAAARALLRDARWDVPGAGPVPLLGQPGAAAAIGSLVTLRLGAAARLAQSRWAAASSGGALAGLLAGMLGGAALRLAAGPRIPATIAVALALIGAAIGGVGAGGVGAGLAAAEALARSFRGLALVLGGAFGGGAVGAISHLLGRWTLEGLFGHELTAVGGGFEGIVLGAAAGFGYALSTPRADGGMATPRGRARLVAVAATGLCCAVGAVAITWSGGHLGGVSLDFMARQFPGSQVGLAPLARVLGEDGLGPATRTLLSAYEGLLFGAGVVLGLTHRPALTREKEADS